MTDLEQLLPLWQQLSDSGTEYVLATVVAVEGSGYRKPGSRMLIGADGRRAGTISGGCLEGDVTRKAFWHTENGPKVLRYSTRAEDGEVPYGMGCGGVIYLLLERSATAGPLMKQLARSFEARTEIAVATVLEGSRTGMRAFSSNETHVNGPAPVDSAATADTDQLTGLAKIALDEQRSFSQQFAFEDGKRAAVRVEWQTARPGLHIFGAGDDVIPLVRLARQMGWFVTVADGRSNLATRTRFPDTHEVYPLPAGALAFPSLRSTDAAVLMTHSIHQDQRILGALLDHELAYLGVLGPAKRTREMLFDIACERGLTDSSAESQAQRWMRDLHAPIGLDLGARTPAEIALEILAEVQKKLNSATGRPLSEIRGALQPIAS